MTEPVLREPAQNGRSRLYRPVRIGRLELPGNLFLAPVAGYSDRAFRSLCVECGASFTYTEMVSAEALVRSSGRTENLMLRADNERAYAVQLFGGEADRVAAAAKIVFEKTDTECIDINAGCPVPKIWKTGAGSALTRDPERLHELVKAVVASVAEAEAEATNGTAAASDAANAHARADRQGADRPGPGKLRKQPVPVTVKIRSGWDDSALTWKEAADAALSAGAAAITLHPRTKAQGYEGTSRWDLLAELAAWVHATRPGIPVFGSGDLFTPESAARMLSETGCDAVMFARGAMGNPFIFAQTVELLGTGAYGEIPVGRRLEAGWRELRRLVEDSGENVACREMRKRFCAYSKGIEGGAALRMEIVHASTVDEYRALFARIGFSFP